MSAGSTGDRSQLRRLEEAFHQTVDLPADERERILAELDPSLAIEVATLLKRADLGRDLSCFEPLTGALGEIAAPEWSGSLGATGHRVGAYRLTERIGQGGMGEVYRAERFDGQFDQVAAVKLVRESRLGTSLDERFRVERQILARLEHPSIARLLDGGLTGEGRPYLVMEYVEGQPITTACDTAGWSLERRLELFCTVCRAVHYAHRNLIVHRDLKPSNILVTATGEVKLLDFGIAKLLPSSESGEAEGAPHTHTSLPLTPGYASPEQIRGEPVTTTTDVYSLGLVLYELLCGHAAQGSIPSSPAALEREICEINPPPPSVAVGRGTPGEITARVAARAAASPARLRRRLEGDLDTIVAVALRKDPSRRYASAEHLALDIERHLEGRAVTARRDTFGYRTRILLRRHRLAVAAASAIVVSLIGGLLVSLEALARTRAAEARALHEARASEQIADFMVQLFRANEPGQALGDTVTARQLLDRGAERVRRELAAEPAATSLAARPIPEHGARLLTAIASAYEELGLFDDALTITQERLELETTRTGNSSHETGRALIDLADLHGRRGEYLRSRELAQRALAIFEQATGTTQASTNRDLSRALSQLGTAHARLGQLDDARVMLSRALELREQELGPTHRELWSPLNNLAILAWMDGDVDTARALSARALAIAEGDLGPDHPSVAHLLNNLALAHRRAGDHSSAVDAHRRALAIRERMLAPDHVHIAESLNNLGDLLREQGHLAEARDLLQRALLIREAGLGGEHPHLGATLYNLGVVLVDLGQADNARPLLERAVQVLEAALGPEHPDLAGPRELLARLGSSNVDHSAGGAY